MSLAWWRYVLVSPLEEAALLVSRLPAGVEHAALVGAVLLHRAGHGVVVAVAHGVPSAASGRVPEPQRGPGSLRRPMRRQRGPSALRRRPLLIRLICPQEEVAGPGVALVELAALVEAVFAHRQEERVLAAVADDHVATGFHADAAATWWRSGLGGPGGNRRHGGSG